MTKQQTYLVTGSAGFIGSVVSRQLLDGGHAVVGLDNLNDYYDVSLKQYRRDTLKNENFEFRKLDIEDSAAVNEIFDEFKFDAVLNLAARAGVRYSMQSPRVYLRTNAMGTLNILESMKDTGVKKYVLASTSSLYAGQPMPFTEDLSVNQPISPYAASKKAAEMMAYSYHHLYDIDVTVCRYFTVYGPAGRPDMSIFRFIKWIDQGEPIQLFGDGTQTRDFTYVNDIARGTVAAIQDVGYEVINLGGGKRPVSINELIQTIERSLGKKATIEHHEFHSADMTSTSADISKAKRLLDWEPETDLEDGIQASIDWYNANRPWSESIKLT